MAEEHDTSQSSLSGQTLHDRCTAAGIKLEARQHSFSSGDNSIQTHDFYRLHLPNGRDTRVVKVEHSELEEFLSFSFDDCVFLGDYSAICSYKGGTIEAAIRCLVGPTMRIYNSLLGRRVEQTSGDSTTSDERTLVLANPNQFSDQVKSISIGPQTKMLGSLRDTLMNNERSPSLKISGHSLATHDDCLALLQRVADAVFFQIDLTKQLPLSLALSRRNERAIARTERPHQATAIEFPRREFDTAPISLYWYARSAVQMPLLQFLAYYQVIEFYFPVYAKADAQRRIRQILKDPTFRVDRDVDIARILGARASGTNYSDERSQLRATLHECLDEDRLKEFLASDDQRKDFLSKKTKGLTEKKIPISTDTIDLRDSVAERIYDLRCKIVHTKSNRSDGEIELLLPFSRESAMLDYDIILIQYVAQQVLIAASTEAKF